VSATVPVPVRTFGSSPHTPRLGRDIAVALAIKLVLLSAIYLLFFSSANRPPSNAAATATAVAGAAMPEESR
jgi:hypothetical protein